jgi:beta-galactosidase/beta-glucuronidase
MRVPAAASALLVLASCRTATASASREIATFDFGWRFRLGLHAEPVPASGGPPEPPSDGPGDDPAEAKPSYDASSWERVHLPHDGLATLGASNISCPTGCSGRSFLPRHVMWYRKEFGLPSDWSSADSTEDTTVFIEFDGVFHATVVYLNGEVVARNTEGVSGCDNHPCCLRNRRSGKH